MKHIIIAVLLVTMTSLLALGQASDKQKSRNAKVEQELIKLEEEWHNAYLRRDTEPLERILADEYIAVSGNGGSSNKTQSIEGLKADKSTYEYSTPYDMDFRFYADTVVVIGRTKEKGKPENGTEFTVEYRSDGCVREKERTLAMRRRTSRPRSAAQT